MNELADYDASLNVIGVTVLFVVSYDEAGRGQTNRRTNEGQPKQSMILRQIEKQRGEARHMWIKIWKQTGK